MHISPVLASAMDLIDLNRYPIHELDSEAGQTMLIYCQQQFAESGACSLPAFVKPAVIAALLEQVAPLVPNSFYNVQQHNVYFKADDTSLPHDHPARHKVRTAQKAIAYDHIGATNGLAHIYTWPPVREFLARVLRKPQVYLHADPLAALNVMVMDEGDELGWHYDRSDFATTILLQCPQAGGVYEFVAHLRREGNENYEDLAQLMAGTYPGVTRKTAQPGTLTLFAGNHSPHRVTPVQGNTPRIVAVLGYTNEPGMLFSDAARIRFYGRAG